MANERAERRLTAMDIVAALRQHEIDRRRPLIAGRIELQAAVPEIMVPFQPIIAQGEQPFAMLQDLWIKHRDWVFEPSNIRRSTGWSRRWTAEIVGPAEKRFDELVVRRAETMKVRRV